MAPEAELIGIRHFNFDGIAGELGIGPDEFEAAHFTHRTAAAVASDEPAPTKGLGAGANGHLFARRVEIFDAKATSDVDTHRAGAIGQDGFDLLHTDRHAGAGRAWQTVRPFRGVDVVEEELDACEMSAWSARLLQPMGSCRRTAQFVVRALGRDKLVQQTPTIEGFDGWSGKPTQAEGKPLQGRVWLLSLLQHQNRDVHEPQLAGEKQADRAASGDHDVIDPQGASLGDDGNIGAHRQDPLLSDKCRD